MKKIGLLFLLTALTFSVKAVDVPVFPAHWDILPTPWSNTNKAGENFERREAVATYFGAYYDFNTLNIAQFEDDWALIPNEYELQEKSDDRVPGNDGGSWPSKKDFETASFKVGYDDEGFFVFLIYEDDETETMSEEWEVMYSPYRTLETGGLIFTVGGEDYSGILSTRYWELGASKIVTGKTDVKKIMKLSGYGQAGDQFPDDVPYLTFDFVSCTNNVYTPQKYCWALKIPFEALEDSENGIIYEKDDLNYLCDGMGLSFDMKFSDNDFDTPGESAFRAHWWNAGENDGFWSADFAGYLKFGAGVDGIDDSNMQSNITITPSQIELAEMANVQIFTVAGLLVKSVDNATAVPTTDLLPGIYIVSAGNETTKFVK